MKRWACGILAAVLLFAGLGLAMVEEIDWAQLDEDMMVMERLVRDALREAIVDPEVRALQEEQMMLEELSAEADISETGFGSLADVQERLEEVRARLEELGEYFADAGRGISDAWFARDVSELFLTQLIESDMSTSKLRGALATNLSSDALYLPGYGAVFAMRVEFPLSNGEEPSPTPEPDREGRWEETRREVLGLPKLPERPVSVPSTYDAELVERVKEALVELLTVEAPNFGQLADNERLVIFLHSPVKEPVPTRRGVRVTRPSSMATVTPPLAPKAPADEGEYQIAKQIANIEARLFADSFLASRSRALYSAAQAARTGLTLSVKASDLAARRAGKITAEELEKRIDIRQF